MIIDIEYVIVRIGRIMDELMKALGKINFYYSNIDEIINGRELEIFRHEWDRVAFEIELMKDLNGFSDEQMKYSKEMKEQASKRIYESTGDSDLAECVYADFGILSDGIQLGYKDSWLMKLHDCYASAAIPTGEL